VSEQKNIGLLGATSLVGESLLSLLVRDGWQVKAFSRCHVKKIQENVEWQQLDKHACVTHSSIATGHEIDSWISAAPIWILPHYFSLLESRGVRRVVVLSSTSRFSKDHSYDPGEQAVARKLAESEALLQAWASKNEIAWIILRPTLIYGCGRDKNISEIARFIRRFGFFPLIGDAEGLRQPIHADDVASACIDALKEPAAANRAYNISGGETLTYREMVGRIFTALGYNHRLPKMPPFIFRMALRLWRLLPGQMDWTMSIAERMNQDLVYDYKDAQRYFNFSPKPFRLSAKDLPV
jgi:hypothetical protein